MTYFTKTRRYLDELDRLISSMPGDTLLADLIVEDPEKGKRIVWLLVATGHKVADRVVKHFGLSEKEIRKEAWGELPSAP